MNKDTEHGSERKPQKSPVGTTGMYGCLTPKTSKGQLICFSVQVRRLSRISYALAFLESISR